MLKIPIVLVKISARNLSTDNLSHLQDASRQRNHRSRVSLLECAGAPALFAFRAVAVAGFFSLIDTLGICLALKAQRS
jgi:hypothetical protein